jgi:glycosyltransferase involved in cell wall biosynthesis
VQSDVQADRLPRITVVTPSFNQAQFLERTIRSVLLQGYPNLEYLVVDGGSSDGSLEVIEKYSPWLSWWVSERDRGQVDAINKGLRRATGDWVAWQNSDDVFYPGALFNVAQAARRDPHCGLVIGNINLIDEHDRVITDLRYVRPTYNAMLAEGMVLTNQAAFWRRELHSELGWLNESYTCAFDFDWFLRILQHSSALHLDRVLGALRIHRDTKTTNLMQQCIEEHSRIIGGRGITTLHTQLYRMRRIILLLLRGHFWYVGRALFRRAAGIRKELA